MRLRHQRSIPDRLILNVFDSTDRMVECTALGYPVVRFDGARVEKPSQQEAL